MADGPRERDIQLNRQRQLMKPYPEEAKALDKIIIQKAAENPVISNAPETPSHSAVGLKTGVPSSYELHLGEGGSVTKSLTDFPVKKAPGRL
jgi:hypothetical protein